MSLIDFVEMFKFLSKHLQDQNLTLNRDLYNQMKVSFIKEAQKQWANSDRYSHSLTYFLFLSIKMDFYDEGLLKFVVS